MGMLSDSTPFRSPQVDRPCNPMDSPWKSWTKVSLFGETHTCNHLVLAQFRPKMSQLGLVSKVLFQATTLFHVFEVGTWLQNFNNLTQSINAHYFKCVLKVYLQ